MRPKYYYRLFGQMQVKRAFALLLILTGLLIMIYILFVNKLSPTIITLLDSNANAIALKATNEAVMEKIEEIEYDNLIHVKSDDSGVIKGLNADVIAMNKLSAEIATDIQQKLLDIVDTEIRIPLGEFFGMSLFSGYGPKITIKAIPTGNVSVDFKTEFRAEGINQTRHRIYLEIKTEVKMVAPFMSDTVPFETNITVAETVIVGDIPQTYYNLQSTDKLEDITTP